MNRERLSGCTGPGGRARQGGAEAGPVQISRLTGPIKARGGKRWPWCALPNALLALSVVITGASAAEDAALAAARAALGVGQPMQAATLLRSHPALAVPGPARVLLARARLALGDAPGALEALALSADDRLAAWPSGARGEAAQTAALARIASGDDVEARRLLVIALADGRGEDPACLLLAAELAAAAGDSALAVRLGSVAWNRRPRLPGAAPAGLLLARLSTTENQTRTLLADIRAMPGLAAADRLAADEMLCRSLLPREPGACLVVAEQGLAQARGVSGQLPLLRALALAALDPGDGLAALAALSPALAGDPAAQTAATRLRGEVAGGKRADLGQRLERARAAAELARWDEVRALIADAAASEPVALALLARAPGADLQALARLPPAADRTAALALGSAFVARGDAAAGWVALAPALAALDVDSPTAAATLHWAIVAATRAAPARVAELEARLRDLAGSGAEIGEAWGREAERRSAGGIPAGSAWLRAAQALPDAHPWRWPAAAQVARAALDGDGDLAAAATVLAPALESEADGERLRCRFLLAQVEARRGHHDDARRIAESLRPHADVDQVQRIDRFLAVLPVD